MTFNSKNNCNIANNYNIEFSFTKEHETGVLFYLLSKVVASDVTVDFILEERELKICIQSVNLQRRQG